MQMLEIAGLYFKWRPFMSSLHMMCKVARGHKFKLLFREQSIAPTSIIYLFSDICSGQYYCCIHMCYENVMSYFVSRTTKCADLLTIIIFY